MNDKLYIIDIWKNKQLQQLSKPSKYFGKYFYLLRKEDCIITFSSLTDLVLKYNQVYLTDVKIDDINKLISLI